MLDLIKEELREVAGAFGDERRTQIAPSEDEIDIEDLIRDQQMVVTITNSGYIKTLPLATYRQQHRGGVGVTGMDLKEGDYIEHLFVCSTHDYLLFFSNRGKVYRSKVYELPEMGRTARGRALVNVLPLREGERIQSVLSTRDFTEGQYLVFATRKGTVKKTEFLAYNTPIKADGIIAIKIRDDDELVAVRRTSGDDEILMISKAGLAVRFHEDDVRSMGRDTSGVRGMNITGKGNAVLAMDVARDEQEVLVVTEGGFGKRTPVVRVPADVARRQGRADDQVLREARRPRRGARRARRTSRSCSSPPRAWSSAPACEGIRQTGRAGAGRQGHEHPRRGRSRLRGRARRRVRGRRRTTLGDIVDAEGPVELDATGGSAEAGPHADDVPPTRSPTRPRCSTRTPPARPTRRPTAPATSSRTRSTSTTSTAPRPPRHSRRA